MRIFMGGTCEGVDWRNKLVPKLDSKRITCFNPVVDDWNEEAQANEIREREICDICLYTITPYMAGCYSIAEVVDDSNKRPEKTAFIVITDGDKGFDPKMTKSLEAVKELVKRNGGMVFESLDSFANEMNVKVKAIERSEMMKFNDLKFNE